MQHCSDFCKNFHEVFLKNNVASSSFKLNSENQLIGLESIFEMPRQRQTSKERIASKAKNRARDLLYRQKKRSDPDLRAQEQAQDTLRRKTSREYARQAQNELPTEVQATELLLMTLVPEDAMMYEVIPNIAGDEIHGLVQPEERRVSAHEDEDEDEDEEEFNEQWESGILIIVFQLIDNR
jgi:hypothetical protein